MDGSHCMDRVYLITFDQWFANMLEILRLYWHAGLSRELKWDMSLSFYFFNVATHYQPLIICGPVAGKQMAEGTSVRRNGCTSNKREKGGGRERKAEERRKVGGNLGGERKLRGELRR